eukprot:1147629-Pelagomonas_calceolata.AAC.3
MCHEASRKSTLNRSCPCRSVQGTWIKIRRGALRSPPERKGKERRGKKWKEKKRKGKKRRGKGCIAVPAYMGSLGEAKRLVTKQIRSAGISAKKMKLNQGISGMLISTWLSYPRTSALLLKSSKHIYYLRVQDNIGAETECARLSSPETSSTG